MVGRNLVALLRGVVAVGIRILFAVVANRQSAIALKRPEP